MEIIKIFQRNMRKAHGMQSVRVSPFHKFHVRMVLLFAAYYIEVKSEVSLDHFIDRLDICWPHNLLQKFKLFSLISGSDH